MKSALNTLLALSLAAPAGRAQAPPANGESFALFQGLHRCTRIDFLVPAGPCELAVERLARGLGGEFELSLDASDRDPAALRVLIGSPGDPALAPLARAVGVEPLEFGFCCFGRDYRERGDALVAVFEDPACAGRPLCLVLGNDLDLLSVYLERIPRLSRPHLWVYAEGDLALELPLDPGGSPRTEEASDYLARRERYFAHGGTFEFEGARVHVRNPLERERWRDYALALFGARKRTLSWLSSEDPPVVDLFVYEHVEDLEECLGTSALSVCNRLLPRVHILLAPGLPDDGGAGLARVLACAIAGAPASAWLADGLALAAANQYWQRPLDEWIAHLAAGKFLPPWDRLQTSEAGQQFSEHALLPARALLFQQLAQGGQAGQLRAFWKGASPDPKRLAGLYQLGAQAALQAANAARRASFARLDSEPGRTAPTSFAHGLALVESALAPYSSSLVDEALAEARALQPGPDALSLTVFACADEPDPPLCQERLRPAHGSASDLALASANAAAHAGGLQVLLALEVLARPSGAWADVLAWASPEDRWVFWERYERVALHYALLAELCDVEFFSFGANMPESTRTEGSGAELDPEQAAQRRSLWQNLCVRLRAAYGGALTYSARFPTEAQDLGFIDQLDYLGLFLFPRVPRAVYAPEDESLRRAVRFELQQALDLAVRWNKPLLLVQLGFPARSASWAQPMVPRGTLDLTAQQRYFEALADVLHGQLDNGATLRGFFLWNWPVDEHRAGPDDSGFSLRQKPAESALRRLFER